MPVPGIPSVDRIADVLRKEGNAGDPRPDDVVMNASMDDVPNPELGANVIEWVVGAEERKAEALPGEGWVLPDASEETHTRHMCASNISGENVIVNIALMVAMDLALHSPLASVKVTRIADSSISANGGGSHPARNENNFHIGKRKVSLP